MMFVDVTTFPTTEAAAVEAFCRERGWAVWFEDGDFVVKDAVTGQYVGHYLPGSLMIDKREPRKLLTS